MDINERTSSRHTGSSRYRSSSQDLATQQEGPGGTFLQLLTASLKNTINSGSDHDDEYDEVYTPPSITDSTSNQNMSASIQTPLVKEPIRKTHEPYYIRLDDDDLKDQENSVLNFINSGKEKEIVSDVEDLPKADDIKDLLYSTLDPKKDEIILASEWS